MHVLLMENRFEMTLTKKVGDTLFKVFGIVFIVLGLFVVWDLVRKPDAQPVKWDDAHCNIARKGN